MYIDAIVFFNDGRGWNCGSQNLQKKHKNISLYIASFVPVSVSPDFGSVSSPLPASDTGCSLLLFVLLLPSKILPSPTFSSNHFLTWYNGIDRGS